MECFCMFIMGGLALSRWGLCVFVWWGCYIRSAWIVVTYGITRLALLRRSVSASRIWSYHTNKTVGFIFRWFSLRCSLTLTKGQLKHISILATGQRKVYFKPGVHTSSDWKQKIIGSMSAYRRQAMHRTATWIRAQSIMEHQKHDKYTVMLAINTTTF